MATLSKKPQKPVSKAKVGTGKSSSSLLSKLPKNKWKRGYLALAAFLLITSVGYTLTGAYQTSQAKAKADNWTGIGSYHYSGNTAYSVRLAGCKTYINAYGGVWHWKILSTRNTSDSLYFRATTVSIFSPKTGATTTTSSNAWLFGVVQGMEGNASIPLGQRLTIKYYDYLGRFSGGPSYALDPGTWTDC